MIFRVPLSPILEQAHHVKDLGEEFVAWPGRMMTLECIQCNRGREQLSWIVEVDERRANFNRGFDIHPIITVNDQVDQGFAKHCPWELKMLCPGLLAFQIAFAQRIQQESLGICKYLQ